MDERYAEIDLLRSLAIVCMIAYHAAFDLSFFYAFPLNPLSGGWLLLQRFTANLFLLVVGVSFAISYGRMERRRARRTEILRKYAKRAALLFACGGLVSAVTMVTAGDQWVRFGALHLISTATLLLPFSMPLREGNVLLALGILCLSPVFRDLALDSPLLLPLGLPPRAFASVDYFPIIPWIAPVLLGAALGNALYNRHLLRRHLPDNRLTTLLVLPGRHALMIYLLHQPLLLLILWILLKNPNIS